MSTFKKIIQILLFINLLFPQYGKNIVQYREFDWTFIQTEHFDIYYYEKGKLNSEFVAYHAEQAYDKISNLIGWDLNERSSIIFYNSHNEFQQTNVVDIYLREGIGGVTELMKNRMVIPYDGSLIQFKHVLYHELVHVFINDGIYGGSLQSLINSNTVFIPLWMNEGLAEYLANQWDVNSDMWIRDLSINYNQLPEIKSLDGYLAYRGGQSVWKFITEKWGEEAIAEIFYSIKVKKDLNKGIKTAIGVDIKELTSQWHKYLKKEYWPDIASRSDIQDISRQLTDHEELYNSYNIAPSPSPDGTKLAMYSNRDGEMGIYILSLIDGKFLKRLIKGNKTKEFEELHILKPGISWSNDNERVVFAAKSGDTDALFVFNINNSRDNIKKSFGMEGIFRPTWNPINNKIAFIGNNGIQSDVYIYDLDNDELKNLTNDWFSDVQVSWHPNGEDLLVISDRGENLETNKRYEVKFLLNHEVENLDIYKLNLLGEMKRLTNTPFNESYASFSPDGNLISFISDESGISNIYVDDKNLSSPKPITNVLTGITQLNWVSNNQIVFTGFYKSGYDIFLLSNINRAADKIKEVPISKWREKTEVDLLRKSDSFSYSKKKSYENYVFSFDSDESKSSPLVFNESILKDSTGMYNSHKYKTRFTLDYARASYTFDSFYGSQGMALFLFSDILGDHRIGFGTELEISLEESDYFLFYRYLKKKINYEGLFYHRALKSALTVDSEGNYHETLHRNFAFDFKALYPFSRFSRIEGGLNFNYYIKRDFILPHDANHSDDWVTENKYPDRKIFLPYLKYVFDNTRWFYLYPVSGSRIYLKYDVAPNMGDNDFQYEMLTLDSRSYMELSYKGKISLATRIYGGTSWGKDKRKYAIGGIPWVSSTDANLINPGYESSINHDQFYYMNNFVFPIRGYELASKYGHNAILMNFELRLPMLMYYFPTIQYLGQIFGVFFVDMGVSWNDKFTKFNDELSWNPYCYDSTNNDILDDFNTSLECTGENENYVWKNDEGWLMSFGFGPRFIFLGMPFKLDYAWQYDPYEGKKSDKKWYLSIGLDF